MVCKLYVDYKYELLKTKMFSGKVSVACPGSTLKTFHQIIIFVVELEGVKIDNFSEFFFCFLFL